MTVLVAIVGAIVATLGAVFGISKWREHKQREAGIEHERAKGYEALFKERADRKRDESKAEMTARADAAWSEAHREVANASEIQGGGDNPGRDVVDLLRGGK